MDKDAGWQRPTARPDDADRPAGLPAAAQFKVSVGEADDLQTELHLFAEEFGDGSLRPNETYEQGVAATLAWVLDGDARPWAIEVRDPGA